MIIEQPPFLFRLFFTESFWRIQGREKCVYLTFDDGPIPQVTPWVLNLLDKYNIKATFFCVGENVARHPELFEEIKSRGHRVGNHTMNHISGFRNSTKNYLENVQIACNRSYHKDIEGAYM